MREPFDFLVIAQDCVELSFTSWKDWLEECSRVFKEFVPLLALNETFISLLTFLVDFPFFPRLEFRYFKANIRFSS